MMLNGPDKGKTGKVLKVTPADNTVLIEGLNMVKRHVRGRKQGQKGQVISKERFIDTSRVAVVCKSCGKPTRIGFSVTGEHKVRICRKCKSEVA